MKIPTPTKGNFLCFLPAGAVLAAILWLTLAPKPLGDSEIPLFEGADKIAHAGMFGLLAFVMALDFSRFKGRFYRAAGAAIIAGCCLLGFLTEWAQNAMDAGRSFEWGDFAADTAGAVGAMLIFPMIRKFNHR